MVRGDNNKIRGAWIEISEAERRGEGRRRNYLDSVVGEGELIVKSNDDKGIDWEN